MKVIGFSSGTTGRLGNVDRIVQEIMEKSGYEYEFIKLTDLVYSGCKGCSWLCAKPQVCTLQDDLQPYIQKVKEADAVVLGTPIHSGTINAIMRAFISRLWGFRHVNFAIKEKPFILAICGIRGTHNEGAEKDFREDLGRFKVNIVDVVSYSSKIPPCYMCGRHQDCSIGGAYALWREKAHSLVITPELFRKWEDDPETIEAIEKASIRLKEYLTTK